MSNPLSSLRFAALFGCAAATLSLPLTAQTPAPDNTARNKAHQTTADQQPNAAADRTTTQKIRQAIIADKSLSTYGHNVKIITQGGMVTLKGPVHSDAEKQTIGSEAASVAGQDKVTNSLTVKQ